MYNSSVFNKNDLKHICCCLFRWFL